MSQPINDNRMVFRENVDIGIFMNPNLSSFEFVNKNVKNIPFVPDLLQKISRARFADCGLTALPPGLENYVCIAQLDLTENNLTNLSREAFTIFENLQTLNLTACNLTKFSFVFKPSLSTLDLSFNPNLCLDDVWNLNLPNLDTIKLCHGEFKDLPKIKPSWIYTVRAIHLDGNNLTELPDYFDEFEKLEELSLFGNHFTKIRTKTLPPTLKALNLYFNDIEKWKPKEPLTCVSLSFNTNPLRKFPMKVLETNGLRALSVSHCEISGPLNFSLPEALSAIDISYNRISQLGPNFIASMGKVAQLIANNNEIIEIANCWPQKPALSRLVLDFNLISKLPESFIHITNLDYLSITNNQLTEFPALQCTHLRTFNLSFNQLTSIPDCFENCSFLADFNVSFNKLTELPTSLNSCRKIADFNISGNKFRVFPKCVYSYSQLRSLSCSNNELSSLPSALGSLFFLQSFDASNNHLKSLPSFFNLFTALKVFSMAHNIISEIPPDFDFPNTINVLDFSYNKLKSFDYDLPSATSINLDCNEITEFNPSHFPSAKFICLNNNPLDIDFIPTMQKLLEYQSPISCFEMLNTKKFLPNQIPPFWFHLMTDKTCSTSERFGIGYSATMGVRPTMEDAITFQSYENDQHLFALFDGHTGACAAATSANCLHHEIRLNVLNKSSEEITESIPKIYTKINKILKSLNIKDGCTAVSAFIKGDEIFTAGIGDSRIVLVTKNGCQRLTTDYKPTMREEYTRLRKAGLTVNVEGRIGRKLAVARTLGDFWINQPGLYVEPAVMSHKMQDGDIGLIIACDGVWDVITDERAAEVVRTSTSAMDAAAKLRNIAFALGSKDNISTMIITFKGEVRGFVYKNTIEELPIIEEEPEPQNRQGDDLDLPVPQPNPSRRRRR